MVFYSHLISDSFYCKEDRKMAVTAKTLPIPFEYSGLDQAKALVDFIYNNQINDLIRREGEDARGTVAFAHAVSQNLMKVAVVLLEGAKTVDDMNSVICGLKAWCDYSER